jgi:hypothetical protein
LTALYGELGETLADQGVQPDAAWLGLDFIGDGEEPISLSATNDQGLYREVGAIYFHVVETARIGVGDVILSRGETLRNLIRGRRIGDIVIERVSPMNFGVGGTLHFEDGYMSGSFLVSYHRDLGL